MTLFPFVATTPAERSGTEAGTRARRTVAPGPWTVASALYAAVLVGWVSSGWGVHSEVGEFILNLAFQPLNLAATWVFWRASRRAAPGTRLRLSLGLFAACYASICVETPPGLSGTRCSAWTRPLPGPTFPISSRTP